MSSPEGLTPHGVVNNFEFQPEGWRVLWLAQKINEELDLPLDDRPVRKQTSISRASAKGNNGETEIRVYFYMDQIGDSNGGYALKSAYSLISDNGSFSLKEFYPKTQKYIEITNDTDDTAHRIGLWLGYGASEGIGYSS